MSSLLLATRVGVLFLGENRDGATARRAMCDMRITRGLARGASRGRALPWAPERRLFKKLNKKIITSSFAFSLAPSRFLCLLRVFSSSPAFSLAPPIFSGFLYLLRVFLKLLRLITLDYG